MILSQKQIEEIAAAVTKNFNEFFFGEDADVCIPRATPISKSAAVIRLRHLGYIVDRPYAEYVNPLEVWA